MIKVTEQQRQKLYFWKQHSPKEAHAIVTRLLGRNNLQGFEMAEFAGNHIVLFDYSVAFDLAAVKGELVKQLDAVEWQFVTTGSPFNFGIAPILPIQAAVAYHAMRTCLVSVVRNEGLLPSNLERQGTDYPDTEGKIHLCLKLTHRDDENDSAEWWRAELSKKNRFNDSDWSIVEVDLLDLEGGRIHKDVHSQSGIIVDRIDHIPPERIKPLAGNGR